MYYFEENKTSILLFVFTVRKHSPEGLIGSNKSEKQFTCPLDTGFTVHLTRMVPYAGR